MTLTLLICGAALAITALCVVTKPHEAILIDDKTPVPLSDPSAETLPGNSGSGEPIRSDWHVATVATLSDAEDFLDALEAQGVEHRELVILGNATFAIRWR